MKVKVSLLCLTLCDPIDYTVHWILQDKILEWVAFPFSRASSQPRDRTQVFHTAGRFFNSWAMRETLYAEYVLWNAGLDKAQAGIKTAGRNINNLRYAGDTTTLMAKSREELKSLLLKVKGEWKAGLKVNIQKTKIMASGPISSWQIDGEKMEKVTDFIFLGSKITAHGDTCSLEEKLWQT